MSQRIHKPRVSVVIPVHNRARYVGTAIESILAQTFTDFELIVIDDGSSDNSLEVVESYTDPRLRLVPNESNLGIPATRNRGLDLSRGEYMAILDSDDWAYPQRLAKQVAFLDAHPEYAVVGAWARWMDDEGRTLKKIKRRPVNADEVAAMLIFQSCLQQPSIMGHTKILRDYKYDEAFDLSSDFELWVRLTEQYKVTNIAEPLVRCRFHDQRTTRAKAERVTDRQQAIYRYQIGALNIPHNQMDIERHQQLPRLKKLGMQVDAHYLEWAEEWLLQLNSANNQIQRYPRVAFSRVLGWGWAQVCQRAFIQGGSRIWSRFWRSPLRQYALSELVSQARMQARVVSSMRFG